MVLENKQTTVAYRCPHCGAGVMSLVGIFNLTADMVKLKCSCGHSEMKIVYSKNGSVRFTVPCVLCPNPHTFTVSSKIFFGKELFILPCPYSDISICMMGDENHVKAELSRSELELLDMLEKSGLEAFSDLNGGEYPTDYQITEIITYVIKELDEEGRIHCRCADGDEREYDAEIRSDGVFVCCKKCGASKLITANSLVEANEFLNTDGIELK